MKVTKLTIKNLGIIEDATIPIDKPLGIFYGDIRQGKSTILNSVRWVFGGAFPADIIRHGCDEAAVTLEFIEDSGPGSVARSWYRAKDGSTKARDVSFIRNGKPVARPVEALKAMLNPFLLDQNHLRNMGETARRQYLAELFGASTPELDREYAAAEQQAKTLRIQIKAVGRKNVSFWSGRPVFGRSTTNIVPHSGSSRRCRTRWLNWNWKIES